ncbi:hypothetical protein BH10PAT2_BH10PAT2_0270 [soil metagenome]
MKKIAVTGLSGEVGCSLKSELSILTDSIIDLSHQRFNLLEPNGFSTVLEDSKPDILIHLAGITHIDTCEADRENGKLGPVWQTNVIATAKIAEECFKKKIHLIYLSTECVFDGKEQSFLESDETHPINWYGVTKAEAEKAIVSSDCSFTILRAVIGYSAQGKKTLWQKIEKKIANDTEIVMANDHWMTPTYLPDISKAVKICVEENRRGSFHLTPNVAITPFTFAQKVAEGLGYSKEMIQPAALAEIIGEKKAKLRLKHACLNSKYTEQELHLTFKNISSAIKEL